MICYSTRQARSRLTTECLALVPIDTDMFEDLKTTFGDKVHTSKSNFVKLFS